MLDLLEAIKDDPNNPKLLEALYVKNKGLLAKLSARYLRALELRGDVSLDDLMQEGTFGLFEAARTFEPTAGKTWAGWAAWYIRRHILRALGATHVIDDQGVQHPVLPPVLASLDTPLSDDGDATLADMLEDENTVEPQEQAARRDLCSRVRAAVDALPGRESAVIKSVDIKGKRIIDTAAAMGQTVGSIHSCRQKGFRALRRNPEMRQLAREYALDFATNFYMHKGVSAFWNTQSSATEDMALWRIEQRERWEAAQ